MLYMVELRFTDPKQESAWDEWYLAHLYKLLKVPGFRSAQRFRALTERPSPLLAIYDVESAGVMTSDAYVSVGGRGSADIWKHLLDNWHRNLFEFSDRAPEVQSDSCLFVKDRKSASDAPLPGGFIGLTPVGLDKTIVERGVKFNAPAAERSDSFDVFRPMTHRLTA